MSCTQFPIYLHLLFYWVSRIKRRARTPSFLVHQITPQQKTPNQTKKTKNESNIHQIVLLIYGNRSGVLHTVANYIVGLDGWSIRLNT